MFPTSAAQKKRKTWYSMSWISTISLFLLVGSSLFSYPNEGINVEAKERKIGLIESIEIRMNEGMDNWIYKYEWMKEWITKNSRCCLDLDIRGNSYKEDKLT